MRVVIPYNHSATERTIIISTAINLMVMFLGALQIGLQSNNRVLMSSLRIKRLCMQLVLKRGMNLMMLKQEVARRLLSLIMIIILRGSSHILLLRLMLKCRCGNLIVNRVLKCSYTGLIRINSLLLQFLSLITANYTSCSSSIATLERLCFFGNLFSLKFHFLYITSFLSWISAKWIYIHRVSC